MFNPRNFLVSAEEAKKISLEKSDSLAKHILSEMNELVHSKNGLGIRECIYHCEPSETTKKMVDESLRQLGYKFRYIASHSYASGYYSISW
jgi:hypothetical protein